MSTLGLLVCLSVTLLQIYGQTTDVYEQLSQDLAEVSRSQGADGSNNGASLSEMLNGDIHEEIYNGLNATKAQFPYQALLITTKNSGSYLCGGSLISSTYVLTAGHCSYQATSTRVYLGLTNTSDGTGAVYYDVQSAATYVHPSYNPNTFQNDVAILKLPQAVTLNTQVKTIALAKSAWSPPATFDNYNVTASGWGKTTDAEQGIHQQLQWRTIHKMVQSSCVTYYKSINPITDGMICTDKTPTYSGPCQGDSGGPLTVTMSNVLYVIGAVSWTAGNCSTSQPIVYTNIAYYRSWINNVTGIAAS